SNSVTSPIVWTTVLRSFWISRASALGVRRVPASLFGKGIILHSVPKRCEDGPHSQSFAKPSQRPRGVSNRQPPLLRRADRQRSMCIRVPATPRLVGEEVMMDEQSRALLVRASRTKLCRALEYLGIPDRK